MPRGSVLDQPSWSASDLLRLSRDQLAVVFRELEAPSSQEMDGEFESTLPDYSNDTWRAAMAELGKEYWLGKSYSPQPLDGHEGHGLNRYRRADGGTSRLSRFVWDIAPSTVDGRPSLVMRYAHFDNWGGRHDLIDEVRVARPNCYLGLYHTAEPVPGFTPRPGDGRSGVEFFILTGPVARFVPADAN